MSFKNIAIQIINNWWFYPMIAIFFIIIQTLINLAKIKKNKVEMCNTQREHFALLSIYLFVLFTEQRK